MTPDTCHACDKRPATDHGILCDECRWFLPHELDIAVDRLTESLA